MAFEKKQAFCVVVGRNGDGAVIEGSQRTANESRAHQARRSLALERPLVNVLGALALQS